MPRLLVLIAVFGCAVLGASAVHAQEPPSAPPEASPRRAECEAELARDARWNAELEQVYVARFHEREAAIVTRNNRHVVLAYGVLWVLTAAFVTMMFLRQRGLTDEIRRLEAQVDKAAKS